MEDTKGISRRQFLKISAAFGGVLALSGVWRAFDTGVFSTGEGSAYLAWSTNYDGLEEIVNAALLAASAHNSQPWLFKLGASGIDIFADTQRNIGSADPFFREMHISLGCALENLSIAAKAKGYSPKITYFPNPQDTRHIAKIDFTEATPVQSDLFDVISKRHMNRGPYDTSHPLSQEIIQSLQKLNTDNSNMKLILFDSPPDKNKIGEAMVEATTAFIADHDQVNDDAKWMRQSWKDIQQKKDGITTDCAGLPTFARIMAKMLPPMSQDKNNQYWLDSVTNKQVPTSAAFGFITVRDLGNYEQIVKAGQLWQNIHLWGTTKGLGMQILNQLSERRDRELSQNLQPIFGDKLREILGTSDWHSVIQFRMGYPTIPALPSPRRPVPDVLI